MSIVSDDCGNSRDYTLSYLGVHLNLHHLGFRLFPLPGEAVGLPLFDQIARLVVDQCARFRVDQNHPRHGGDVPAFSQEFFGLLRFLIGDRGEGHLGAVPGGIETG